MFGAMYDSVRVITRMLSEDIYARDYSPLISRLLLHNWDKPSCLNPSISCSLALPRAASLA